MIYLFYMNTLLLSSDTPEEGMWFCYRWLWATMGLLGIELRTSGRAAVSALNHWATSPALGSLKFKVVVWSSKEAWLTWDPVSRKQNQNKENKTKKTKQNPRKRENQITQGKGKGVINKLSRERIQFYSLESGKDFSDITAKINK